MHVSEGLVVVGKDLEQMLITKPGAAVSTTVVGADTLKLSVVCVVSAIGTLVVIERVVGIQYQTVDNLQRSLGDNLITLPDILHRVLVDERQWVVVL